MKMMIAGALVLLLSGCASSPESLPSPEPLPAPVLCALPEGQTIQEPAPERPVGDYTQRDVALYIERLHRWGNRGWTRLAAAREWSDNCVDRAAVRDGGEAR